MNLFIIGGICLIVAGFWFVTTLIMYLETGRNLKLLNDALKTIKHYEILVHGKDRFIIPYRELEEIDKEITGENRSSSL